MDFQTFGVWGGTTTGERSEALLNAGAILGYWPRGKAGGVSEAVRNGLPAWRVRRLLMRL